MFSATLFLLAFSLGNAIIGFSSANPTVAAVGKALAMIGALLAVLSLATARYFAAKSTSD